MVTKNCCELNQKQATSQYANHSWLRPQNSFQQILTSEFLQASRGPSTAEQQPVRTTDAAVL